MKKLFLLDAMALIYRAFFALNKNPRINSKGLNTSAILGFANTLLDVLQNEKPTHIGVCFDTQAPTARHIEFQDYKANREAMPDELSEAIPYIQQLIEAFDIPILSVDGYEADDVIGTLAKKAEQQGFETYMMTPDKDFGQLVSEHIFIYKPAKFGQPAQTLGVKEVCERHGIKRPEQVIDLLGLMGDSADNFPGIPGVGEVTARKLLEQFDNMDNLLANTDQIANVKLREKVENNKNLAIQSRQLATIDTHVPIDFEPEKLAIKPPKKAELTILLDELDFRTFERRINTWLNKITEIPVETHGRASLQIEKKISNQPFDLFNLPSEGVASTPLSHLSRSLSGVETTPHQFNPNYTQITDLSEFAKQLSQQSAFCFDTETTGIDALDAELVGIAFCFDDGTGVVRNAPTTSFWRCSDDFAETKKQLEILKPIFENPNILKIGQNLKYDINVLSRYGIEVSTPFFDTMIAHYVLHPERKSGLDDMVRNYLNHEMIPIDVLIGKKGANQKSMRDVPIEWLVEYACEDADMTFRLKPILDNMANDLVNDVETHGRASLLENIEFPLIPVLAEMEREGVKIDSDMLEKFSQELTLELSKTEEAIYQLAGVHFNIASPKQLGEILFENLKIDPKAKRTGVSKQYATGEDVLQKLKYHHPIVDLILTYRSLAKLRSTYVDALPALINPRTGRVHTSFNQAVVATGRLSSSNPNLQNIPIRTELGREIRKAFVPRDKEHILMSADYSQIELRIIASISGDESMIADFVAGHDIHTATAAKIYGVPMSAVDKEMRRSAKSINFGIVYGMSAFGLAEQLGISRSEASNIIKQYFEQYPKIAAYMQNAISDAKTKGYAETLCGRRRYLPDVNSPNATVRGFAERNAINAPIQGSSADMIKIAMVNIAKRLKEKNLQSKMILQVHDELVFDVLKTEVDDVKTLVITEMQNALELKVPIVVEASTGETWLEAH
ncbi:MAG: DNA polymerase I [Bacteroidales bacterium]|jgi:DNA polymerase-1|nr:DNA polymerase I [Bacteroidales bacterium]